MDELSQAYERMGLEALSSKEEVERRYDILLRQARTRTKPLGISVNEDEEFALITQAYRTILSYEERKVTDAFNEQEYGKFKKHAGKAQKVDHFWRYYKYHTLGAIVMVALIIYGISAYVDHREHQKYLASLPPIDLQVGFMGNYYFMPNEDGDEALDKALLSSFPEWQRFSSSYTHIPEDQMSQLVYLQKAIAVMATEKADVYIADKFSFNWIGQQEGIYLDLQQFPELNSLIVPDASYAVRVYTEELNPEGPSKFTTDNKIYGIDLTNSKLISDLPLEYKPDMIIGIRADSKRVDNAVAFIAKYMQTMNEVTAQ